MVFGCRKLQVPSGAGWGLYPKRTRELERDSEGERGLTWAANDMPVHGMDTFLRVTWPPWKVPIFLGKGGQNKQHW